MENLDTSVLHGPQLVDVDLSRLSTDDLAVLTSGVDLDLRAARLMTKDGLVTPEELGWVETDMGLVAAEWDRRKEAGA